MKYILIPIFLILSSGLASAALTDNLVGYWKIDENTGATTADEIASADGSITGAAWAAGQINYALDFDGTNDYTNHGDNLDFEKDEAFSISVWFKFDSTVAAAQTFVSKFNSGTAARKGYLIGKSSGNLWFTLGDSNYVRITVATSGVSLDTNWHHFVATYDGSATAAGVTLYYDGSPTSLTVVTDALSSGTTENALELKFGNDDALAYDMNGKVDEVGIWSRELSSGEVTSLYNSGSGIQYPFSTGYAHKINAITISKLNLIEPSKVNNI